MKTTRVRVRLREIEPAVVRVLDVPATAWLPEVHDLLQAGLGWTDSHLHQFITTDALYGKPLPDLDAPQDEQDESQVRLCDLPDRFVYLYDFGDSWEHDVELLGAGEEQPACVDGEGTCPPEDCGGPGGYADLLQALSDPTHPEHAELRTWVGDRLVEFDQQATDLRVRQTVGAVPAPVRLILDQAAGGVKLTPGGRLPRTFVRAIQQHYPHWHPLGRPAALEEDLPPLAAVHDLLRGMGLLRLHHGALRPIRAVGDEIAVIRRLRSWFGPDEGFTAVLTGVSLAVLATDGPHRPDELAERVYPWLGHGWVTHDGNPLTIEHTRMVLSQLTTVLEGLDLIRADLDRWSAGPSACWLLPRAIGLSHLWAGPQNATPAP